MLKRIDPKAEIKTVSILDGAIDKVATGEDNLKKFEESHDFSLLKMKEGEKPTFFIIKNIPPEGQLDIQEKHYVIKMPTIDPGADKKDIKPEIEQKETSKMMLTYFKSGCVALEENGERQPVVVDEFPLSVIQEIGGFIMIRSSLGDEEKK